MLIFQALNLSETPIVGGIALAVAVLLGILAPMLFTKLRAKLCLLGIFVGICIVLEVLMRLLGIVSVLQILSCVLTPFTCGLIVGTFVQLVRHLAKRTD